ncbi:MAG: hypothetical protein NTZ65_04945 [Candidatus Berkelbacteria bacterium]|nr:hypothetical protein [Candidatus Berkelbacteria bacterium]
MMTKKEEDKEFYRDLDKSKKPKSSCSPLSFIILMVLVLILAEVLLFAFSKSIKNSAIPQDATTLSQRSDLGFVKIPTVENSDRGFQVVISEGVLCSKIALSQNHPASDYSCKISQDGIEISGKIVSFLPRNTKVTIVPKVQNDQLKLDITKAQIGSITILKFLTSSISGVLNDALLKDVPELKSAKVTRVNMEEGIMIVWAEKVSS